MKKWSRIFGLAAILILMLAGTAFSADSFTESEIDKIMNDTAARVACYQNIAPISPAEFQKLKPGIESAEYTTKMFALDDPNNPEYIFNKGNIRVTLKALPGYEKYRDVQMAANFDGYEVHIATSKDGKYRNAGSNTFYAHINNKIIENSSVPVCNHIMQVTKEKGEPYGPRYLKVRFFKYIDGEKICTKWSDVYESYWPMAAPGGASDAAKIAKNKIYVEFSQKSGTGRNLQIREKGSSKWVNVTKSKLVDKVEYSKSGCTLKLDTSKDYEFRARYTYKVNGKTEYSLARIYKKLCNPTFKVKDVSFLRYDKNSYAFRCDVTGDYDRSELEQKGGYEVVCRKAGSSNKWKKVTEEWVRDAEDRICFDAKPGYEYKIRLYWDELGGGHIAYGPYSDVFRCTKTNVKFDTNDFSLIDEYYKRALGSDDISEDRRPAYDRTESIMENFNNIRSYMNARYFQYFDYEGCYLNPPLYESGYTTVATRMERESEGKVGVQAKKWVNILCKGAIYEYLCFYGCEPEVANALLNWKEAVNDYGNANSDYFGFKDVKNTDRGFIIEMNGRQIEVEFHEKGTIYWFDLA